MSNQSLFLTRYQSATIGLFADTNYGSNSTVHVSGDANHLTGGDENFLVNGYSSNSSVALGNGSNAVSLNGNNNIVALGAVRPVSVTGSGGAGAISSLFGIKFATDYVMLNGSGNSLVVGGAVNATLIGSNNSMTFGNSRFIAPTGGPAAPALVSVTIIGTGDHIVQTASEAGGSNGTEASICGGAGNNFVSVVGNASINLDGFGNTIVAGCGASNGSQFTIFAGSGNDHVTLLNGSDPTGQVTTSNAVVHLVGTGNEVTGGSNAVVSGGSGNERLMLGSTTAYGSVKVNLGGLGNSVAVKNATVIGLVAGSGSDTVSLLDAGGNLTFRGSNNMLFISGNGLGPTTVNDLSAGLRINVANDLPAPLTIAGNDRSFLIDLAPGVGGFSSVAQITQNLHSDGAGGMYLSAASGSSSASMIHFVGDNHVTAANFVFGKT